MDKELIESIFMDTPLKEKITSLKWYQEWMLEDKDGLFKNKLWYKGSINEQVANEIKELEKQLGDEKNND